MAHPWDPEITVTSELATRLISDQFQELRPVAVEPLGEGWDNTAYLANSRWVFRFPRRDVAVPLIAREMAALPPLASRLPLRIPVPRWQGQPSEAYPWPFAGYQHLSGVSACSGVADEDRLRLARPLAEFLRALHAVSASDTDSWSLPGDEWDRLNVAKYQPRITAALDDFTSRGIIEDSTAWTRILVEAERASLNGSVAVVHGDLHPCHLLVAGSRLAGVIDWGDIHRGHTALDVSIVWTFLPVDARPAFFDVYGAVDEAVVALARFRALMYAVTLEAYGRDRGDAALVAESLKSLHLSVA